MESTKHERIYLQVCDDSMSEWYGEVTWCQDRVHDEDVEYRRADLVEDELAAKDTQIALLREALEDALYSGNPYSEKTKKALAATADLSGLVLCEGEPVGIIGSHGHPKHISYIPCITENKLYGPWKPIFRAREQK